MLTQGADPGLVSHLLKRALRGLPSAADQDRRAWARLAKALGVKAIPIAERDTPAGAQRK